MANEAKPGTTAVKKFEEGTVELVLKRVTDLQSTGGLSFPPDYSVPNALRSAWLILQETKDASKVPVLTSCTKESISNSLFNMAIQGLNPMKKQCAFIARGSKLTMQRMYAGSIALARRFGNVKEIHATTIYLGDEFEYEVVPETGRRRVIKHIQEMENIDETKIKGCYAVVTFNDGTTDMLPMTIAQVRTSWSQGELGGKGPAHVQFASSMAEKTVINKICKIIIDSSDDSVLTTEEDDGQHDSTPSPLANKGPVIDIPEEEPMQEVEIVEEPEPEQPPPTKTEPDDDKAKPEPAPTPATKPGQTKAPF